MYSNKKNVINPRNSNKIYNTDCIIFVILKEM